MKSILPILIITLVFFVQLLSAQTFTEVLDTPFEEVAYSAIAFADVDGDNDQDVLIVGDNSDGDASAKLYLNEDGEFIEEVGTPFFGSGAAAVAFADVDGDNDMDVMISGDYENGDPFAKLYTNESGEFTEVLNTPFIGGEGGTINFSDIDGDNDLDVFISGEGNNGPKSTLYLNDSGEFTEDLTSNIVDFYFGDCVFSDVDGDGDEDLLFSGLGGNSSGGIFVYTNDGGVFTIDFDELNIPFLNVGVYSSLEVADIEGDGDPDVLITGIIDGQDISTRMFVNDGGVFTERMNTPFEGLIYSSIAFSDIDGDSDPDVLITGATPFEGNIISKLYTNEEGNFTEVQNTPFEGVALGSIAFSDIDGDNDEDLMITGGIGFNSDVTIAKLYTNDGIGTFVKEEIEMLDFPFEVYPNPSVTDEVNISLSSNENCNVSVTVLDLNGRLLQRQQEILFTGEQTFSINISLLNKGSYLIQLDDGQSRNYRKLVVQ